MAISLVNNLSMNRSDTAVADQVWTATSATLSDFQGVSGVWNLLLTDTVSAEATVEFDSTYITSTYKIYKILISELVPASVGPGTEMFCQFKQGGSYITSGYGFSSFHHVDSSSTSFNGLASGSATAYQITSDNLGGDTGENSSWELTLDNPAGTANDKIMWGSGGNVNHDNSYSRESTIGGSFNVGAITAIKFFMESDANFTSGRFSLYGITT